MDVYKLLDEMVTCVDVLGLSCCHGVGCECDASVIVCKHHCGFGGLDVKSCEELVKKEDFLGSGADRHVLGFHIG
jgi:hypothetical protein